MNARITCGWASALCLIVVGAGDTLAAQESASAEARLAAQAIWEARTADDRSAAAESAAKAGIVFDELATALRLGRDYADDAATGVITGEHVSRDGTRFPFFLQVPDGYTPDRAYPVRVFLHGGVSRAAWEPQMRDWWRSPDRVKSEEYIGVFPASWSEQRWWQDSQVENLREILRAVRSTYNIDNNRVSLIGVSDGGTGAYFVAFKDTTPWASFLPFISHPAVLLNPRVGATAEVFRGNLTNKPLFIVNGEVDRLYPTRSVDPFIADFSAGGVEMVYRPLEGVGHEVSWWPSESQRIEEFIAARPREPHPRCISWETEAPERSGRAHWLRIDELGSTALDTKFEMSNLIGSPVPSGRVDVQRRGNDILIASERVRRATLLLSPDAFDFGEPVSVWWNGVQVMEQQVQPDIGVLARWAARDDDKTMLYGAELTVIAPESGDPEASRLPDALNSSVCRGV